MTLTDIVKSYEPYDTHEAFGEGFVAYQCGTYNNPHSGVAAQAWDRGLEAASRWQREQMKQFDWGNDPSVGD